MLAKVLGFTTAIGVTLAIVRKARDIFWSAVGVDADCAPRVVN